MIKQLSVVALLLCPFVIADSDDDFNCPKNFVYDPNLNKCTYFAANDLPLPSASSYCSSLGGHLPSIHNGFTNAFFSHLAVQQFHNASFAWLGARIVNGKVKWDDGTAVDYAAWKPGQNISAGVDSCVVIGLQDAMWYLQDCNNVHPVACFGKQEIWLCDEDEGWSYNHLHCYKASDTPMSHSEMSSYCHRQEAQLASVHSVAEQRFTQTIIPVGSGPHLVGLCHSKHNEWTWSDGTALDFDLLQGNYPNTTNSCAALQNIGTGLGATVVNTSNAKFGCVCKKNAYI